MPSCAQKSLYCLISQRKSSQWTGFLFAGCLPLVMMLRCELVCKAEGGVGVLEGVVARATGNICDWRCTPQTMAALLSIQSVRLPTACQQSPRSKRVSHTPPAATPFLVPTHLFTCFCTFSSPSQTTISPKCLSGNC